MLSIDSSDDEEIDLLNEIRNELYNNYLVNRFIDSTIISKGSLISFYYRLGLIIQHLSDRFFRHTSISKKYLELKDKIFSLNSEDYDYFGVLCLKGQIFPLPHSTHSAFLSFKSLNIF